jgi:hypothetical protein
MSGISRATTPITTDEQRRLEAQILAAHKSGNKARLARLQERYRSSRVELCSTPTTGPMLVERVSRTIADVSLMTWEEFERTAPPVGQAVPGRVVISPLALDSFRHNWNGDFSIEYGGGLVGFCEAGVWTVMQLGMVRTSDRAGFIALDFEDLTDDSLRYQRFGWALLGDWHSHRWEGAGGSVCSSADRRCWKRCAERSRRPWLGLILGPGGDDGWRWVHPRLRGWVIAPGGNLVQPIEEIHVDWEAY